MRIGVPVVVLFVPLAWWSLTRRLGPGQGFVLPHPGPWRPAERRVLAVFGLTALAWVTRTEPAGGWAAWFGTPGTGDSTVALAAALVLFLLPDGEGGVMLDWKTANKIPWGLLILFGGGIAIARAFEESGLSKALGGALAAAANLPALLTVVAICFAVTFLTEVTSNTATATLLMPVLAAAALGAGVEPALLMVPATLSASCAFMLPVATAPNAVVFGTDRITTSRMAREGFVLNLAGVLLIGAVCFLTFR
jgi:sodium-dependent dicarboxylate transporter 2/3/5